MNITPKYINKLDQKKIRKEQKEFIIEGVKGVIEALKSNSKIKLVIIEGTRRKEINFIKIINLAQSKKIPVEYYGRREISKLKTTDTFPGIMAIVEQSSCQINDILNQKIICLDDIKDPGNLGTIIRTADWFGIKSIILSENCVELYNSKVIRSTMGSIFHINIYQSKNLGLDLSNLKQENNYFLAGLTLNGEDIEKINLRLKTIYILGNESHGISPRIVKLLNKQYTIKGKGQAESLNVAVSAGILCSRI